MYGLGFNLNLLSALLYSNSLVICKYYDIILFANVIISVKAYSHSGSSTDSQVCCQSYLANCKRVYSTWIIFR